MIDSSVVRATEDIAVAWLREGRRFVQGVLVEVEGSAPLPEGAMILIGEGGEIEGSITGGCVEDAVVSEAEAIMAGRRGPRVLTYGISDGLAGTVGLMCGGIVHILLQELTGAAGETELAVLDAHLAGRPAAVATLLDGETVGARLGIVDDAAIGSPAHRPLLDHNVAPGVGRAAGGGQDHDPPIRLRRGHAPRRAARPHPRLRPAAPDDHLRGDRLPAALAPFAARIGYQVAICDARDRFARPRRFSADAEVWIGWPQELMEGVKLGPRDAVLVFTHDPKFDEPALATDAGYIALEAASRHKQQPIKGSPACSVGEVNAVAG